MLYLPWKVEELHRHWPEASVKLYHDNRQPINENKLKVFPLTKETDPNEECLTSMDSSAYRAQHIGDSLDPQVQQMIEDDFDDLQSAQLSRFSTVCQASATHRS